MTVRAKMRCTGRAELTSVSGKEVESVNVTLQAVYGDGKENAEWSKWTPCGQVTMTITNAEAFKQFELGKCYFVDFSPTEG